MATVTVKVDGLQALSKAMGELGRKASNRISTKAMRKGGAIIRDNARAKAPELKKQVPNRKRGTVKKAITARTKIKGNGRTETIIWVKGLKTSQVLKFKGKSGRSGAYNPKDPFYWRFLEFGTSKMPARPFLRPAFEQSKNQATKAIIETLRSEIIKEGSR